jgi:hypothetical protein
VGEGIGDGVPDSSGLGGVSLGDVVGPTEGDSDGEGVVDGVGEGLGDSHSTLKTLLLLAPGGAGHSTLYWPSGSVMSADLPFPLPSTVIDPDDTTASPGCWWMVHDCALFGSKLNAAR